MQINREKEKNKEKQRIKSEAKIRTEHYETNKNNQQLKHNT